MAATEVVIRLDDETSVQVLKMGDEIVEAAEENGKLLSEVVVGIELELEALMKLAVPELVALAEDVLCDSEELV